MADKKIDFSLNMSKETAARFSAVTEAKNLTNEQALSYLLDLYDEVKPKRDGIPGRRPLESHLHTCVRPEIRSKFRQLAREYSLSYDQLLTMLIDTHDGHPSHETGQAEQGIDVEDAKTEGGEAGAGTAHRACDNSMAQVEAALDTIRSAFLRMSSESEEVKTLREQLAQSQAETRKAKEAYQETLQAIMARLQDLD